MSLPCTIPGIILPSCHSCWRNPTLADFTWSDLYLTKWFALTERLKLRTDGQFFNLFNHPNFGLRVLSYAGVPGKPATQTAFGALTYTTSPPTGLLGVRLSGDSSPGMIAFQARLEF